MHLTSHPAGALAVPVAFAAAFAAALVVAEATAGDRPGGDRVELEVAGVLSSSEGGASIVVLREKGAPRILPVLVPGAAGRALQARLRDGAPGDAAPALLDRALAALGARVVDVELTQPDDEDAGSRVHLAQGRRALDLPARPAESLVVAVAAGVPILIRRRVLDRDGLGAEDLARLHRHALRHDDVPL